MDTAVRDALRRAGAVSREARERGVELVREGALLRELAEEVEDLMRRRGLRPSFPTCLSIDDIAAHYTPTHDDTLRFRRGNVVKLDLGAQMDGWIADTAVTVEVGTRNWTAIEPFASSGAGQVDGRRTGNIYRVVRPKPLKQTDLNDFLALLSNEFKTLPFAERWAHRLEPRTPALLNAVVRTGAVMTYPALLDVDGGIVAQTEHTMIVGRGGAEVTTA